MDSPTWLIVIENIVFWSIIVYIVIRQQTTPTWAFGVLALFILWFAIRIFTSLDKMNRLFIINIINQAVILFLFYRLSQQRQ
jgi:hypothetical protein